MKTLPSMVAVMATALMLSATSLAVGGAKNQSAFTAVLNVVRVQSSKELIARREVLNRLHHLGVQP
jgi:hypothetical protein